MAELLKLINSHVRFDIKYLKENKIAIGFYNNDEYQEFIKEIRSYGCNSLAENYYKSYMYEDKYKEGFYVDFHYNSHNQIGFCHKKWYEKHHYSFVKYKHIKIEWNDANGTIKKS